jgi:hypothetical protein
LTSGELERIDAVLSKMFKKEKIAALS